MCFPSIIYSPVLFYTTAISSFTCSTLVSLSLCLHHFVSLCGRFLSLSLCFAQPLAHAVGSADLCCWLEALCGCACVYVCLPTCICVYSWKTSCCVVTRMLVFAVTAVRVSLCLYCSSFVAGTLTTAHTETHYLFFLLFFSSTPPPLDISHKKKPEMSKISLGLFRNSVAIV